MKLFPFARAAGVETRMNQAQKNLSEASRSADFPAFAFGFGAVASERSGDGQVCFIASRVAGQTRTAPALAHPADLEIGDTAGLETCATQTGGARLWSQTQPQRIVSAERVGDFVPAAAGASHTAALLSLTPWLQPGVKRSREAQNRFNGFPPHAEAVETAEKFSERPVHRAKATVLMRFPSRSFHRAEAAVLMRDGN